MSTKQVNNTKAPKADSSKSKEQEAQKGNAMATADKTNTKAPEAAPEASAPAPAPAAKAQTKEQKDEARYQELLDKDSTTLGLSDEEEEEFLALRAARKKAAAGKRKAAEELVENYVKAGLSFADFATLLSDKSDALRSEIAGYRKPKTSSGKSGNRQQTAIPEESLVIHMKAGQGQGFRVSKEKLLEGKWGTFASKLLKDLNAKDEVDFVAKLKEKGALRNDFEELYKSDDKFKEAVKTLFTHTTTKGLQPPPKKKPA